MWEAKAAAGRAEALAEWVLERSPVDAQVYRSEDRVVLITRAPLPWDEAPPNLIERPSHAWEFDRLR